MHIKWQFVTMMAQRTSTSSGNLWHWRCTNPDGTTTESAEGFTTIVSCAADARAHGYSGASIQQRLPVSGHDPEIAVAGYGYRP